MGAELLEVVLALGAGLIGVDEAADADDVAELVLFHGGADLGDAADDFMAGDAGIGGGDGALFIAHLMEV